MKKYFILKDEKRIGPLSFDDLKAKHIDSSTLIWFDGEPQWKKAGQIKELRELFKQSQKSSSIIKFFKHLITSVTRIHHPQSSSK